MNQTSNIFMLAPSDCVPGVCSICGQAATIRFRDASTGQRVGDCCCNALLVADRELSRSAGYGIRHPTLQESRGLAKQDGRVWPDDGRIV